jgi:hypothetical protein
MKQAQNQKHIVIVGEHYQLCYQEQNISLGENLLLSRIQPKSNQ